MAEAVGIDLGTTNCAVAHIDEFQRPVVLTNASGASITPSVICFQDGEVVVGEEAKDLQRAGEPDVAAFFKRKMGDPNFAFFAAGRDYSATDLSAILLEKLKRDAEAALGAEVVDAVVTVPAYFHNPEREATIEAGRRAGLNVLQVINEPTAAAKAYGCTGGDGERLVLVYDLGGGTFDVTLLRMGRERNRVLSSDGDQELGGKDWDMRVVEFLGTRFQDEFGRDPFEDAESTADLLVAAEEAKMRLSGVEKTLVSIRHAGDRGRYELDRTTFAEITRDLMERTLSLTNGVLRSQNVSASDLDEVLLVGGSTRMHMVHDHIQRELGKTGAQGVNVDEAVALGAAITAHEQRVERGDAGGRRLALPGAVETVDVTNHSLGMIALNADRSAYINSIILPKDSEIPGTLARPYQYPVRGRSRDLEVYMTQGESQAPDAVTYLGKYRIADIPPDDSGVQVIEVEYSYDISGTVRVGAKVKATGEPLVVAVEPLPDDVPARFLTGPDEAPAMGHTTAYLVIDVSGSMSGAPLEQAKKAALEFLYNVDLAHCSIGVLAFADRTGIRLEACQDAKQIASAIDALGGSDDGEGYGTRANPFVPLHELLHASRSRLGRLVSWLSSHRRLSVLLTDGVWSDQPRAIEKAKECHDDGIEVIAIGFGGANREFLKQIASTDEAGLFTDLDKLVDTFGSIAQEITASGGELSMLDDRGVSTGSPRSFGLFKKKQG